MRDATFVRPDLTTFCGLDALGLEGADRWCRGCGAEGAPRDTVTRRPAHETLGRRPTTLPATVRRLRRGSCGRVWRQDTSRAAEPRAKLTRAALRWAPRSGSWCGT